ncbi:MAG: hypothetical protein J6R04_07460, partial [Clostridia bacterium]|nr:hypothetical protein [Clostridia bacterium]
RNARLHPPLPEPLDASPLCKKSKKSCRNGARFLGETGEKRMIFHSISKLFLQTVPIGIAFG